MGDGKERPEDFGFYEIADLKKNGTIVIPGGTCAEYAILI